MSDLKDTITVEGKTYKMTYGLMMDLQRVIPDAEQAISYVLTDSFVRDYIMRRVLTNHKGILAGEDQLIKAEDVDLSPDQAGEVLNWAIAHLLDFFVKSAQGLRTQGERLKVLAPSEPPTDGSTA